MQIRLSADDLLELRGAASAEMLTLAAWVRRVLLQEARRIRPLSPEGNAPK